MRRILLVVLVLATFGALAGEAAATGVTPPVTVDNTAPSNAAGATTSYAVTFTATSALTATAAGTITITFPAGTDLTSEDNGEVVRDVTTSTDVGFCSRAGLTATCSLFGGQTINPGDTVKVTLNGVVNPPSAVGLTATVSTSTDQDPVVSSGYDVVANQAAGAASVVNATPSNAAAAVTSYDVTFSTSSTGGLSSAAASEITIAFPAGTNLTSEDNGEVVRDVTTSTNVGSCSRTGLVATCTFFGSASVAAGDTVKVTLNGIVNPGAATGLTVTVDTSSDTQVVSSGYDVVANQPLTNASVVNTAPSNAAGAVTSYDVTFSTSSTGGLSSAAASEITITFPAGTNLTSEDNGEVVRDVTTSTNVGSCSRTGLVATCTFFGSASVAAGDTVKVTLNGIVNPGAATGLTVTVDTSSDTQVVSSGYDVVANQPLTNASVVNTAPSNAAGAVTSYAVTFTTSSTGAMSNVAGSELTITFPAGTNLTAEDNGEVIRDVTTSADVGSCSRSGLVATCSFFGSASVASGDTLRVTLDGVVNPGAATGLTVTVDTSSDTQVVSSGYNVIAAQPLGAATVVNTAPSNAAGAITSYDVTFTTSSTGALSNAAGSAITITFPIGTNLTLNDNGEVIRNVTTSTDVGSCSRSGLVVTCSFFGSASINAGDTVKATINGVVNPGPGSGLTVTVDTSSDTQVVSGGFSVVATQPVQSAFVELTNYTGGATDVTYTVTMTPSSAGGLGGDAGSIITVDFPAGTNVSALNSGGVVNVATAQIIGFCFDNGQLQAQCELYSGQVAAAGQAIRMTFEDVVNPPGATNALRATVDTSSDTPVNSATYGTAPPSATPTPTPTVTATATSTPVPTSTPTAPPIAAPVTTTGELVAPTTTSLKLTATINPNGQPTTMHFEYGTEAGTVGRAVVFASTDEQTVGSDFTDHVVTADVRGLLPNSVYRVRTVATNPSGQSVSTEKTIATPADPPPPPPVIGKTFNVQPVSGLVLVEGPDGTFVPLTQADQIAPGVVIDARKGALQLTSATTKKKKLQKGVFKRGVFTVAQSKKRRLKGIVELRLARSISGVSLSKGCNGSARLGLLGLAARKPKPKVLNLLKSDAKGNFRTRGKYSAATVRGTKWDMADRCDGTLTTVERGSVSVLDFAKRKTVTVGAGDSYLAKS